MTMRAWPIVAILPCIALNCDDDGPDEDCFSPTQNVGSAYEHGAYGCECDPEQDEGQCVWKDDTRTYRVSLICAQDGKWRAVIDGPCTDPPCLVDDDCPQRGSGCFPYVCNTEKEICESVLMPAGTACEGDPCQTDMVCNEVGDCTLGTPFDCSGTGDECNADSWCVPATEANCDGAGEFINQGGTCGAGGTCVCTDGVCDCG